MDTYTFVDRGTEKVVLFLHIVYFWKQIKNNEIISLIGLWFYLVFVMEFSYERSNDEMK